MSAAQEGGREIVKANGNGHAVVAASTEPPSDFLMKLALHPDMRPENLEAAINGWIRVQDYLTQRDIAIRKQAALEAYLRDKALMQAAIAEVSFFKNKKGDGGAKSADFGATWAAAAPIWTKWGFTVDYDVSDVPAPPGYIDEADKPVVLLHRVVGKLAHREGHVEMFHLYDTHADCKGPRGNITKTMMQGKQSTVTYVKRNLLYNMIGIAPVNEETDKDGSHSESTYREDREIKRRTQYHTVAGSGEPQTDGGNSENAPAETQEQTAGTPPDITLFREDTWLGKTERALNQRREKPSEWKALYVMACERAPTPGDLTALSCLPLTAYMTTNAPAGVRADLDLAYAAAKARLNPPTPEGETTTDGQTEPAAAAAEPTGNTTESKSEQNEPDSGEADHTPMHHEAVRPPMNNGKPVWSGWKTLILEELHVCPGFDLADWIEPQRGVIEAAAREAPAMCREVVAQIAETMAGAGLTAPAWLPQPLAEPTTGAELSAEDRAYFENIMAQFPAIKATDAGRKFLAGLFNERAKSIGQRVRAADPALYERFVIAYDKKQKELRGG